MDISYLQGYKENILIIINFLFIPAVMAIALLTFLWGVYNYFILGAESEDKRSEGRQFVLWGVIGFAVIASVWGLVYIVGATFGFFSGNAINFAPPPPKI
ncbi:MAG: hypothetical protein NT108_00490 [Candidatus Kaiserbacteria bacterium]|nr:hypothetical protein [Candidatus Kaiserbacteria bacterium]